MFSSLHNTCHCIMLLKDVAFTCMFKQHYKLPLLCKQLQKISTNIKKSFRLLETGAWNFPRNTIEESIYDHIDICYFEIL